MLLAARRGRDGLQSALGHEGRADRSTGAFRCPPGRSATTSGAFVLQFRRRPGRSTCPRQESNLHPALRRRVLYPLSYEGGRRLRVSGRRARVGSRSSHRGNSIVVAGLGLCDISTWLWYSTARESAGGGLKDVAFRLG